jgi:ABC-type molybdate transport system substrate-binding protein
MSRAWIYLVPLVGLGLIGGAVYLLLSDLEHTSGSFQTEATLVLWCGQELRGPIGGTAMEHGGGLAEQFERRTGIPVKVLYGEPSALLQRLTGGEGTVTPGEAPDLFLPGDAVVLRAAESAGLIESTVVLAGMVPVILLEREQTNAIQHLSDLSGRRVGVADARTTALGRVTRELFIRHGLAPDSPQLAVSQGGSTELARSVQSRQVEAAVVWRHMARRYPGHPVIDVPESSAADAEVAVAVLRSSRRADDAKAFAAFLAGPVGQAAMQRYGLEAGD